MALNLRADLVPLPYTQGDATSNKDALVLYLYNELLKLRRTIADLTEAVPQAADAEPPSPRRGTVRFCVSPWDPLGTSFEGYVVYDGAAWVAL